MNGGRRQAGRECSDLSDTKSSEGTLNDIWPHFEKTCALNSVTQNKNKIDGFESETSDLIRFLLAPVFRKSFLFS